MVAPGDSVDRAVGPPPDTGLDRRERVRRRPEFLAAYERGRRLSGRLMTVFLLANGGEADRLGIAATRKYGNAVARNRAKRHVREAFRRNKPLAGLDIIVVPKREMRAADYASIEADYRAILNRRQRRTREA